jgi:hypothetical protein
VLLLIGLQIEDAPGKIEPSPFALVTLLETSIGGLDSVRRDRDYYAMNRRPLASV